jgi:aromatic ring-cleaving dioxygenase
METRVIKSLNRRDAKLIDKQIDTLGIRASLRSRNETERKMAIQKLLENIWWLVEGYSPRKIGDLLTSIYLVGFSHNLFIALIRYLTEFRRRAELHRSS